MNGRKLATISTLFSGVAAAALLAGAFVTGGQNTAYASQMATIGGTANSGIQVQNLSTSPATIQVDLYSQAGGAPAQLQQPGVVGEGSANFYLPSAAGVGAGAYGVVLSSDQPIAAIARTEWTSGGRSGAATYGTVAPAQSVILPLALGPTAAAPTGYVNQLSQFSIQNAGATGAASVSIQLYGVNSAGVPVKCVGTGTGCPGGSPAAYSIAAGTSRTITLGQGDFTGLPDTQASPRGFVGYARITSSSASNPLVVQSFVDFTNSSKAVYAFSGVGADTASTTLYAPLLRKDYFGTTGVSLVNPNGTPASVQVTYYNDPGSPSKLAGGSFTETITVPANSSLVAFQGSNNNLPDATPAVITDNKGWFGSAKMVANVPILAVVNDAVFTQSYGTVTSAAYNASSTADGGTKIFAPLVRRRHTAAQLTTGIQVQNVGAAATNITVTYKNSAGAAAGSTTINNVAAGASVNFYQDAAGSPFPSGTFGSAVITSSGAPIVLIVNDFSIPGTANGLDAALYNGLK
jgi:hypothetical protein